MGARPLPFRPRRRASPSRCPDPKVPERALRGLMRGALLDVLTPQPVIDWMLKLAEAD